MQNQEQELYKDVSDSYMCPSFSSYAANPLAGIAEHVGRVHYRAQNDDSDFEFVAFREEENNDDKSFFDDTVFPLFKRDFLREHRSSGGIDSSVEALRFPMGRLLIGGVENRRSESDTEAPPSSESSSEADDLEGIPAGTYCVWTPNSPQASSRSTRLPSSKRWKLIDLFRRSNSDGNGSFVFMTTTPSLPENKMAKEKWRRGRVEVAGKPKAKGFSGDGEKKKASLAAHKKRSTFLPYRQELFGFCRRRLGKDFH